MPLRCTKRKKNPRTHRTRHTAMQQPSHSAHASSPEPPTGPAKGDAALWPPVSGARPCVREAGTPNGAAAARKWPAQFGRKPGLVSEPATGFIFANRVPEGNPCDASDVLPLLDKVQGAIERVRTAPRRQIHSVAGDLGINDAALRQALHQRGML